MSKASYVFDIARCRLVTAIAKATRKITPKEIRFVWDITDSVMVEMPKQLKQGAEGGIVVVPWGINAEGKKFADKQRNVATYAATEFRKKYDIAKNRKEGTTL